MVNKKFSLSVALTITYVIIFCSAMYGLRQFNIIDDAEFVFNVLLVGLYQWLYLIPIILVSKRNNKDYIGYLMGGICISFSNLALWIWIILDPSTFF